ncbi:disintegrin and metalloproteinase domain-containing protein 12-like [Chiloscyllium punctatum]|uniref:disintegrin and metalloproteinase domain-containing protein 12-like n=1 Tax=Chiloscyllium punctatum TaxID=137246 RepID=UPI003B63CF21
MLHDDGRGCACPQASCLMIERKSAPWPISYSSCSKRDFENMLLRDRGVCLMSRPDFKNLPGDPQCGNMFTERGEQCDCGKPEECGDPCCDPATCKFKRGAECSSTELCCEDCKFLPMGTVCRPLMGECDLEEYCYGNSSICPDNVFLKDGYECKDGASYCSAGACQSPDIMCEELWGSGAQSAEDICYSNLNAKGDEFGHCGKDQYDQFQNCQPWFVTIMITVTVKWAGLLHSVMLKGLLAVLRVDHWLRSQVNISVPVLFPIYTFFLLCLSLLFLYVCSTCTMKYIYEVSETQVKQATSAG